jgi:hypothetical protein
MFLVFADYTSHFLSWKWPWMTARKFLFSLHEPRSNVLVNAMKAYRGRRGVAPLILNLSLDGGEWLISRPIRSTPRDRTHEAEWGPEPVWEFMRSEKYLSPAEMRTDIIQFLFCASWAKQESVKSFRGRVQNKMRAPWIYETTGHKCGKS